MERSQAEKLSETPGHGTASRGAPRGARPQRAARTNGERSGGGSALREPGDTFPFSCPQLTPSQAHRAPASTQSLSPAPSESGHHASPPWGCISRQCQAESGTRRGAGGDPPAAGDVVTRRSPICRCLSLPGPYNILPSTNRGSCNVRARAGGRGPGVAPAQPALIGSGPCPTPGLWQAQGTFKPCPLLTAGPMTLLARCCFERTFASFSCYILPR